MSWSRGARAGFFAATVLALLSGCATVPGKTRDPHDPWERMNRATYRFNSALDRAVVKPVAVAYRDHVPQPVRTGVSNFVDNIQYTSVILNDFLQGKLLDGVRDTGRLLLNSTVGIGGVLDPATAAGLDKNDEDFGQTLGRWGVPSGPYLVIPFVGPSSLRDAPATYVDTQTYLDELLARADVDFFDKPEVNYGLLLVSALDSRANLLSTEKVLSSAYDQYAFVRNAWLQHREYQVRDGNVPEEEEEEFPEDEPMDPGSTGADESQPDTGQVTEPPPESGKPQAGDNESRDKPSSQESPPEQKSEQPPPQ